MSTLRDYGITNAYTKDEVDSLIPVIPENVSAFINDVGYLTEHQDISGKQDKLNNEQMQATDSGITSDLVNKFQTWFDELATKQDMLTERQMEAINSKIDSAKVNKYNTYEDRINSKADKATTLSGYGITDTYTKSSIDAMFEELLDTIQRAE